MVHDVGSKPREGCIGVCGGRYKRNECYQLIGVGQHTLVSPLGIKILAVMRWCMFIDRDPLAKQDVYKLILTTGLLGSHGDGAGFRIMV
jgi:hypothetical protein